MSEPFSGSSIHFLEGVVPELHELFCRLCGGNIDRRAARMLCLDIIEVEAQVVLFEI